MLDRSSPSEIQSQRRVVCRYARAAHEVHVIFVVDLDTPDRHTGYRPNIDDVPDPGLGMDGHLLPRGLAGKTEDGIRGREVDHVTGRCLGRLTFDPLSRHGGPIAET